MKHTGWVEIGSALGCSADAARNRYRSGSLNVEKDGTSGRVWATDEMLGLDAGGCEHAVDAVAYGSEPFAPGFRKSIDCEFRTQDMETCAAPDQNTLTIGPVTVSADDDGVAVVLELGPFTFCAGWDW